MGTAKSDLLSCGTISFISSQPLPFLSNHSHCSHMINVPTRCINVVPLPAEPISQPETGETVYYLSKSCEHPPQINLIFVWKNKQLWGKWMNCLPACLSVFQRNRQQGRHCTRIGLPLSFTYLPTALIFDNDHYANSAVA